MPVRNVRKTSFSKFIFMRIKGSMFKPHMDEKYFIQIMQNMAENLYRSIIKHS